MPWLAIRPWRPSGISGSRSRPRERVFQDLAADNLNRVREERERAEYAFETRRQAVGRLGLPTVRDHRLKRLTQEHEARLAALDQGAVAAPDLHAVLMVRVDATGGAL